MNARSFGVALKKFLSVGACVIVAALSDTRAHAQVVGFIAALTGA